MNFEKNQPYVMGSGNRTDLLIKAGVPGTYLLQVLDPGGPNSNNIWSIITQSGIDPAQRLARIGFDFPVIAGEFQVQGTTYPYTLAIIVVSGDEMDMDLPEGPLPVPEAIPSIEILLETTPDAVRNVAFEICGQLFGMANFDARLSSCGWYFSIYDAEYWGGNSFTSLLMMRDADDEGIPNPGDPEMPRIDFQKEGLFDRHEALFSNMNAGNFEEWTIYNRTFSDHPFHIHVNPFLVTHINGKPLPQPEYRDTIIVPAAIENEPKIPNVPNIQNATFGSITFRTEFDPAIFGQTVIHCHNLTHEDVGMMQRVDIIEPAE